MEKRSQRCNVGLVEETNASQYSGGGVAVQWWRLPVASAAPQIGSWLGFSVGFLGGGEPRTLPPTPHLFLLYGTAQREPTSCVGLGIPDQDTSQGPRHGRWAKSGGDQPNILPLDLILYF